MQYPERMNNNKQVLDTRMGRGVYLARKNRYLESTLIGYQIADDMTRDRKKMKISELSARSEVPVSTIKFYIRKELLPKPTKTAGTQGFYTAKHLDRLKLIQKIQKEGNVSLQKIREITGMIDASEEREKREQRENEKSEKTTRGPRSSRRPRLSFEKKDTRQ